MDIPIPVNQWMTIPKLYLMMDENSVLIISSCELDQASALAQWVKIAEAAKEWVLTDILNEQLNTGWGPQDS